MKYLLILIILFSTQSHSKSPIGKSLICVFGKKKNFYETYLFYENKYISKYLFLENDIYKVRKNEKRKYSITKYFINMHPFLIDRKNLTIIDTELNRIIGRCEKIDNHNKAIEFIYQLKNIYQNRIDKNLGRVSI